MNDFTENRIRSGGILLLLCWCVVCLGTGCAPSRHELQIRFFPGPPEPPRIQFLQRISSNADIVKPSVFETMVTGGQRRIRFAKPYGVAAHGGKIYVCDAQLHTIFVIDPVLQTFKTMNSAGIQLNRPLNIAISPDGFKYVTDYKLREVIVFDAEDRYVRSFSGEEGFKPTGIAVSGERLYVSDIQNNVVDVLDRKTGESLSFIGEPGQEEGQLYRPSNVAVDREGNVYVTDVINSRVEKFDPEGDFLLTFGKPGDRPGDFARPKGIAVDGKGFLYAADSAFENVQIFSPEAKPALFFGGFGGPDVPGALWLPAGIALTDDPALIGFFDHRRHPDFKIDYLILVISQYGPSYLNIYAFGNAREGSPLAEGKPGPDVYGAPEPKENTSKEPASGKGGLPAAGKTTE